MVADWQTMVMTLIWAVRGVGLTLPLTVTVTYGSVCFSRLIYQLKCAA